VKLRETKVRLFILTPLLILLITPQFNAYAIGGPSNEGVANPNEVFVVYNSSYSTDSNSDSVQDSLEIANYYKTARSIPDANVVGISAPTTEAISRSDYDTYIKAGIESALTSAGLENTIKYIVLIYGIPLKIQDTSAVANNYTDINGNYSSVDSAVTLLYQTYSNTAQIANPYYNADSALDMTNRFETNTFSTNGVVLKYLVTRLDGYTVANVKSMIDRASNADTTGSGYFVLDKYSGTNNFNFDSMSTAHSTLKTMSKNVHPNPYSTGTSAITTAPGSVVGYTSYGLYAGLPNNYYNNTFHFTYLNGAVASTYESYAAFSMIVPDTTNHGQVAQFIAAGGSGGIGNVYEPYSNAIAEEDIWMASYASGYTWADSAYMSLQYIDWTTVVFGDPLMMIVQTDTTAPSVPGTPVTTTPTADTTPTFTWSASTDAGVGLHTTPYTIAYSQDVTFATGVTTDTSTTNSYTPGALATGSWYFKVKARDSLGNFSAFSSSSTAILVVTPVTPYVSGSSALLVTSTTATLSGSITSIGTGIPTIRGFEYGTTTSYGSTVSESGSFGLSMAYTSQFGSSGSGNGQFLSPYGIALDSSGNIYVADILNHRVQKFDSSGVYVSKFGTYGTGDGQFNEPNSIVFDSSGNIYVLDSSNERVQKFDSSGVYISQFGTLGSGNGQFGSNGAVGIAIDSTGNIYVVDKTNNRVQKFNSSGVYVSQFGSAGSGDGQFNTPRSITLDTSGNIYIGDTGNDRVQKFNSSGVYVSQFGSTALTGAVTGITVDSSGDIYVIDESTHRVRKFDSSGTLTYTFGTSGSGNGQLSNPNSVAVDSSGNLYVTDSSNRRVQKFNPNSPTSYLLYVSGLTANTTYHFRSYVTNASGTVYDTDATFNTSVPTVATSSTSSITETTAILGGAITTFGGSFPTLRGFEYGTTTSYGSSVSEAVPSDLTLAFLTKFGTSGTGDGQFAAGPNGIAFDTSGNVYVVDIFTRRGQKFTSTGVYVSQFGSNGSGDGQFSNPNGIAIDSSGNIYVADSNNHRIQKFDSSGVYVSQFGSSGSGDGQFNSPASLAFDSSGNIYVADTTNHRIQKFTSGGVYVSQFGSSGTGDGQFSSPKGIVIDSSGNIIVADTNNERIQKFDSSGVFVSKFGSLGSANGFFGSNGPRNLALDASGNIFVADTTNHRIQKFTSGGVYVSKFGSSGTPDGQFSSASTVAIHPNGAIYVADLNNSRVQVINYAANAYVLSITGLTCGTTYHYRAYSTNTSGTGYGDDATFTTSSTCPTLTTTSTSSITGSTATLNGNITAIGGATPTVRGFQYGTTTSYGTTTTENGSFSTGAYTSDITGLTCNTVYHFRSYSTSASGTGYSSDDSFTTDTCLSTITTTSLVSLGNTTATLNGNITNIGGSTPTIRGFQYGLTTDYGTTSVENGTFSTGAYTVDITGLTCGTTYNYRSYSTNISGTGYGSNDTFATGVCSATSSSTTSSTSASGRINNLISMGKIQEAQIIINEFPNAVLEIKNTNVKNVVSLSTPTLKLNTIHTLETRLLQQLLNTLNSNLVVDGKFGPKTLLAVKEFQIKYNLVPDGIVGPKTWTVINNIGK
jgi:tripartite motif-containing protein 71